MDRNEDATATRVIAWWVAQYGREVAWAHDVAGKSGIAREGCDCCSGLANGVAEHILHALYTLESLRTAHTFAIVAKPDDEYTNRPADAGSEQ